MLLATLFACTSICPQGTERLDDGNCYAIATQPQPALGGEEDTEVQLVLTTLMDAAGGLFETRDLEFNPAVPGELWTVNSDDAVVVIHDANGTPEAVRYSGSEARHWLARPSALAFGDNGLFTTSHEDLGNDNQQGDPSMAMGPTLWPSDLEAFDGGRPSHLDMVHDSPLSMGVAWEQANEYWVHDGYNGCLTWYDFAEPHEPGGTDHADASIVRYLEGAFSYVEDVPSHLAFDQDYPNVLYHADTGNNRIVALNIASGGALEAIGPVPTPPPPHGQATAGRWRVTEADTWDVVLGEEVGLVAPSGLEVHDGLIWVTDNATNAVWAFTPEGEVADVHVFEALPEGSLTGLAFDADGALWLADAKGHRVLRVDAE